MGDVIEIDIGDVFARLTLDSIERWTWTDRAAASKRCAKCGGSGKIACGECNGEGVVECNLGHEHDCEECDADGKWECGKCYGGYADDDDAVVEIVMRWHHVWQCDVTTFDGRIGSSIGRDTPQDAFEAAALDAVSPQKRNAARKAA